MRSIACDVSVTMATPVSISPRAFIATALVFCVASAEAATLCDSSCMEAAVSTIRSRVPGAQLVLHDLDLSSLGSVAALGETLLAEGAPLHLMVNNAG